MGTEFITVYWRDMLKFFRFKVMLFASLIQPALWLVLFGVAMSSYFEDIMPAGVPMQGTVAVDYLTFMAAGVISMTILFTCLYSGVSLQLDKEFGLLKSMMVSPMARSQLLAGLTMSGVTKSLLQVIIIMVFGLVLGAAFFGGFSALEVLAAIGGILLLTVLFATGLMFLSTMISMKIESHEGVQAVITMLTLPLFFASNALYPLNSMPVALKVLGQINPLTYFIDGIRYFTVGSDFYSGGVQYSYGTGDVLLAIAFLVGFCVVMFGAMWSIKKAKVV